MTWLDKYIQKQRFKRIGRFIPHTCSLLDIGAHRGELFLYLNSTEGGSKQVSGVGVEPLTLSRSHISGVKFIKGQFPEVMHTEHTKFDVITMLAVLEHVPIVEHRSWSEAIAGLLKPGGLLLITVPDKRVDFLLDILTKLRLIDGMSLEEHFGFDADITSSIFSLPQFKLVLHQKFQFGLNNLFVFERMI